MEPSLRVWLLMAAVFVVMAAAHAVEPLPPKPPHHVLDLAGALTPETLAEVSRKLTDFQSETGNEVFVFISKDVPEGYRMGDFTRQVAEAWSAGTSAPTAATVVFIFTRSTRLSLEYGRGGKALINDESAGRIVDGLLIPSRKGYMNTVVRRAVDNVVAAGRGNDVQPKVTSPPDVGGWVYSLLAVLAAGGFGYFFFRVFSPYFSGVCFRADGVSRDWWMLRPVRGRPRGVVATGVGAPDRKGVLDRLDQRALVAALRVAKSRCSADICIFVSGSPLGSDDVGDRASARFRKLGMDRRRARNGLLIYLAPNGAQFAVFGDKRIHDKCGDEPWHIVTLALEHDFREGRFTEGVVRAVEGVAGTMAPHFPIHSSSEPEPVEERETV